jgi:integrase
LKPRSYEEVERHLLKHAKPLHGLQLAKIDRRTVATLTGELVTSSGPRASDAVRASLSTFFAWAMSEGLIDANPVVGTNRAHDNQSRDRVLTDGELLELWGGLLQDDYSDIVRLLLLTGQRRDEIGKLQWSEIDDHDAATITLPPSRTKNRRKHIVSLSEPALAILKARRHPEDQRKFVFGRSDAGYSGWSKSKQALDSRILEARSKAGKPMIWRLHDLRRTMSTTMHDRLGIAPHIVEAVLNHISGHKAGVAGTYNWAVYAGPTRIALDKWAEHIATLISGKRLQTLSS